MIGGDPRLLPAAEGSRPQKRKGQSLHSGSRRRGPTAAGPLPGKHQAPLSSSQLRAAPAPVHSDL